MVYGWRTNVRLTTSRIQSRYCSVDHPQVNVKSSHVETDISVESMSAPCPCRNGSPGAGRGGRVASVLRTMATSSAAREPKCRYTACREPSALRLHRRSRRRCYGRCRAIRRKRIASFLRERAWSRQRRSMRQSTWPGSWPRQASGRAERGVVRESLVDLVRLPLSPPIFPIALDYESPTTEIRSTTICPSAASPATSYVPRRYAAAVSAHSTASSWSASSGTEVDSGRPAM